MAKQPVRVVTAISIYFLRNREFRERVKRRVGPTERALVDTVLDAAIDVAVLGIYKPDPFAVKPRSRTTQTEPD